MFEEGYLGTKFEPCGFVFGTEGLYTRRCPPLSLCHGRRRGEKRERGGRGKRKRGKEEKR